MFPWQGQGERRHIRMLTIISSSTGENWHLKAAWQSQGQAQGHLLPTLFGGIEWRVMQGYLGFMRKCFWGWKDRFLCPIQLMGPKSECTACSWLAEKPRCSKAFAPQKPAKQLRSHYNLFIFVIIFLYFQWPFPHIQAQRMIFLYLRWRFGTLHRQVLTEKLPVNQTWQKPAWVPWGEVKLWPAVSTPLLPILLRIVRDNHIFRSNQPPNSRILISFSKAPSHRVCHSSCVCKCVCSCADFGMRRSLVVE